MARSPADIPGLLRWGSAADAAGTGADLTIRDRVSGTTYRQITTTAQVTTITTSLFNGKQALVFTGTAAGLIDDTPLTIGPAFSVWVAGYRTGGGANSIFAAMDTVNSTRVMQLGRSSNPTDYLRHVTFATDSQPRIGNAVGLGTLANPKSLLGTASAARAASYVNGDGGTQATAPGGQTQSGSLRLTIGRAEPATTSYYLTGRIAAWAIFDHELTTAERTLLDSWAQDEYGIAVSNYVPDMSTPARTARLALGLAPAASTRVVRFRGARIALALADTARARRVDRRGARLTLALRPATMTSPVLARLARLAFSLTPKATASRVDVRTARIALTLPATARSRWVLPRIARVALRLAATAKTRAVHRRTAHTTLDLDAAGYGTEIDVTAARARLDVRVTATATAVHRRTARLRLRVDPTTRATAVHPRGARLHLGLTPRASSMLLITRAGRVLLDLDTAATALRALFRRGTVSLDLDTTATATAGSDRRDVTITAVGAPYGRTLHAGAPRGRTITAHHPRSS